MKHYLKNGRVYGFEDDQLHLVTEDMTLLSANDLDALLNPPAPVPQVVTMRQARLALLGAGVLSEVDTVIDALPSPFREAARIEWEYAATVERSSALVATLASELALDDAALDALFVAAAAL